MANETSGLEDPIMVAWLAGLLEGEGCFQTVKRKLADGGYNVYPKIVVEMTDFDIMCRLGRIFGVSLVKVGKKQEHHKQSWRVTKTGTGAKKILKLIQPHMGFRRKKSITSILKKSTKIKPRISAADYKDEILACNEKGLSQRAIAKKLGVSSATVCRVVKDAEQ